MLGQESRNRESLATPWYEQTSYRRYVVSQDVISEPELIDYRYLPRIKTNRYFATYPALSPFWKPKRSIGKDKCNFRRRLQLSLRASQ